MRILPALALFLTFFLAFGPANAAVTKDISYGPLKAHALDLYQPDVPSKNMPVVLYVHGGGWAIGTKSQVGSKPEGFNKAGFIFISMDYPLVPDAKVEDQAAAIISAIKWIKGHISEYGGDADNISIMGHSAGGHLVALVGTDESYLKAQKLSFANIKAVIPLDAGTLDVPQHMQHILSGDAAFGAGIIAERRLKKMFTGAFGSDPAYWESVSPYHYIKNGNAYPPFLLLTVADRKDSSGQATAFSKKLNGLGGTSEFYPITERTHRTINKMFGEQGDESFAHTLEFLKKLD